MAVVHPVSQFPAVSSGDGKVAPYFYDWIAHRTDDPYWQQWVPQQHYAAIGIPVLHVEGWYDAFLAGGVHNFTGMVGVELRREVSGGVEK
jgi:predicted acyl esterase